MITLVVGGQIIWVVAAIIGLLVNADSKFIWTCITGALLGFVGIALTIQRDKKSAL
jgi:uncharacterized membrane protein YdcZ (DUF606 family)